MKIEITTQEGETGVSVCQMAIDLLERQSLRAVSPSIKKAIEASISEAKLFQSKMRSVAAGQATMA